MTFAVRYLSIEAQSSGDLLDGRSGHHPQRRTRADARTARAVRELDAVGRTRDGGRKERRRERDGDADLPAGVTLWCDSEGQAGGASATIAHVNAWAAVVKAAGYDPGLYVGAGTPLDGQQLYALDVDRYWKSFSQSERADLRLVDDPALAR